LQSASPTPRQSWFDRLGRAASARPRAAAAIFLLVALFCALYGVSAARELVASGLDVPGSESDRVARKLATRLGVGSPDIVAVLHAPGDDVRDPEYAGFVVEGPLEPVVYDTPWAGLIDAVGGLSLGIYARLARWKRRRALAEPGESTGFRALARKPV
jgi:hypothetical protein